MTLKNTDNEYRIKVSNRQTIDSETDTIEETAYGNYTEKNGKQYITYKTENNGDKISSMIKIDGNEILIKRTGSVNSSMTYKVDTKKEFLYHLPYEMCIRDSQNTKGDTKFMNILFVCTGNTCRSAMAAAIMDKIAVENDLDVFIESAGIFAEDGQGASENAIKALMKYGIDLSGHRTQPVTEDLIKQCDLILTMTEGHKQILEPLAKGKVYTLLEYAGSSGDISDPYGGDLEEYEEVAQEIYDALVDLSLIHI